MVPSLDLSPHLWLQSVRVVKSDGLGTLGPGEVLQQPWVPPLNFSLESPGTQSCAACQNLPGIQKRTEPLPACPGTLQAQGVPRGTLKTPQEARALNNPSSLGTTLFWPAAMLSMAPSETTRVSKHGGGILWLGGQLCGPLLWLQVGGWGLQKRQSLMLQRTKPPASPSLPGGNLQGLSGFERRGDRKRH